MYIIQTYCNLQAHSQKLDTLEKFILCVWIVLKACSCNVVICVNALLLNFAVIVLYLTVIYFTHKKTQAAGFFFFYLFIPGPACRPALI